MIEPWIKGVCLHYPLALKQCPTQSKITVNNPILTSQSWVVGTSQHTNDPRTRAPIPGDRGDSVRKEVSVSQHGHTFRIYPFPLSYLIFLSLSLLICEMGVITMSASWNTVRIPWIGNYYRGILWGTNVLTSVKHLVRNLIKSSTSKCRFSYISHLC